MKKLHAFFALLFISSLSFAQTDCNNYWSAISPDGNYIYFSSDRDGEKYEIYRVDIDGTSNLIRLTNDPAYNKLYPAVSPDGSLIAFQYGNYGATAEVYIMNNDGSNLNQLTDNGIYDGYPNFSPDGTKIVFDAWDNSSYPEVFTMKIDGTERTQLTNETGPYWQSAPIYNPSGTKIVMSAGYNADNHFVYIDLDGNNWVDITPPNTPLGDMEYALHFNSNATKIAFQTNEYAGGYNTGWDIVTADIDGSNWNQLTNSSGGEYNSFPFFHPTNNKIYYSYFSGNTNDYWSIYTMDLDGSNAQEFLACSTLGLSEDFDLSKNLIYPNPSHGAFEISHNSTRPVQLKIIDVFGKLIYKSELTNKTSLIDLSHHAKGIYFVHLIFDNKWHETKKIIIN